MYQLKGFIGIETMVNNATDAIAPIGELSTHSMTFAKDKGIYTSDNNRLLTLFTFSSKSSDTSSSITCPQSIVDMGLLISDWVYTNQISNTANITRDSFLNSYINQFNHLCDTLGCGEMIQSTGGFWFPEWITWKNRNYVVEDNVNKIWFSDASFRAQYDEYEIIVVPPVTNIDVFFKQASFVLEEINKRDFSGTLEAIRIARNNLPETILEAESYDWVSPINNNVKYATTWSLIIYGPAGNDLDIIVSAISDYILQHSVHSLNEWKIIFPDIFKHTEFIIIPKWNNYAIENLTLQAGIYSPIVNMKNEIANLKLALPDYAPAHIENHAMVMPNPYKSIALTIIGNFENRNNLFEITQVFPDIINVSTTSNDFNRMSSKTQGFLNLLSNMIPMAETMTKNTSIPVGMRKTLRNGVTYLTATYSKIQYMIVCKKIPKVV
jgi:hypothetical protein